MDRAGAGAFIYSKSSGILGSSFVGSRLNLLFEPKTLSELWTLIFKTPAPMIPETMLAQKIENDVSQRLFKQYTDFVNLYDKPDSILLDVLSIYEGENLKEIGAALCSGETELPHLIDLGSFATLKYKMWPDISAITKGTVFSWYNRVPDIHEQQKLEFKIDMQIIRNLWESIQKTSGDDRTGLLKILKNQYIIKNIVWALRLRVHYGMEKEDVIKNLFFVTGSPNRADPFAGPAIKILDYPLDEYDKWASWRYARLVNPYVEGEIWKINPGWIEKAARADQYKMDLNVFHQYPMTTASLVSWYRIKRFEVRCICSAVESLRLNINSNDAMATVGVLAPQF